ncbi:MAG: hypothetical protein SV760_00455 [Halobacteria archaeon]|nr:hypothetical protein [Halobacteria archaeon]
MDDAVSLVVDPDTFFRKRRNDPGALVPALVLLGVGLVTVGVGLYRRGFMMSVAPEGGRTAAFSPTSGTSSSGSDSELEPAC